MAKYQAGIDITLVPAADLDSNQYYFVAASGADRGVGVATGGSAPGVIGILQNDPRANEAANVRVAGVSKLVCEVGTAIAVGDFLVAASDGQGELATGSVVNARALEALSSGSAVIEVLITNWQGILAHDTP